MLALAPLLSETARRLALAAYAPVVARQAPVDLPVVSRAYPAGPPSRRALPLHLSPREDSDHRATNAPAGYRAGLNRRCIVGKEYGISCVTFGNRTNTRITSMNVRLRIGLVVYAAQEWTKEKVIAALDDGDTFVTLLMNRTTGEWEVGQTVRTYVSKGVTYLRTDDDELTDDNLDNLPECPADPPL